MQEIGKTDHVGSPRTGDHKASVVVEVENDRAVKKAREARLPYKVGGDERDGNQERCDQDREFRHNAADRRMGNSVLPKQKRRESAKSGQTGTLREAGREPAQT